MRIHYVQHVPFEDWANVGPWMAAKGHSVSCTRLFNDEPLPDPADFDWLVVMGGPMNIYEHDAYPWLAREKAFLAETISRERAVLGICLGAQLIADVLGGPVSRNAHLEIGWFDVELTEAGRSHPIFAGFPEVFPAFHWHGDAFTIPPGAAHAASTPGCANQAFIHGNRVVGLQFHIESSEESVEHLLKNCADEMTPGPYVQDIKTVRDRSRAVPAMTTLMARLLENMAAALE